MKERIARGQIPDEFRNATIAIQDDDGGIWVAVETEAEVQRYDDEGHLLWQVRIDDPQIQSTRARFFERAQTDNPMSIAPLRYFADLYIAGEELWILLEGDDDDPAVVLTLDDLGRVTRRISVPAGRGAGSISYDPAAARLLLGTAPDAQLISVRIGT